MVPVFSVGAAGAPGFCAGSLATGAELAGGDVVAGAELAGGDVVTGGGVSGETVAGSRARATSHARAVKRPPRRRDGLAPRRRPSTSRCGPAVSRACWGNRDRP